MLLKSATFLCLIVISYSATIQPRNIPVEVRYEDKKENENVEVVEVGVSNAVRNLDAKVQLSPEELRALPEKSSEEVTQPLETSSPDNLVEEQPTTDKKEDKLEELPTSPKSVSIEEKISDESKGIVQEVVQDDAQREGTSEAPTELPEEKKKEPNADTESKEDKPAEKREISDKVSLELKSSEQSDSKDLSKELVTAVKKQESEVAQKLQNAKPDEPAKQEPRPNEENPEEQPKGEPQTTLPEEPAPALMIVPSSETNADRIKIQGNKIEEKPAEQQPTKNPNGLTLSSIIQEAREIIKNGLKELKDSLKTETGAPKPEQWNNLETTVNNYLTEENKQTDLKADKPEKQSFIQNIASNFQSLTEEFMKSWESSDEKKPSEKIEEKLKDQARENSEVEQPGTPCGAVASFLQSGFNNIQLSLNNLGQESTSPTTSATTLENLDASTATALGSRILPEQIVQEQTSAESSGTNPPEAATEQSTTVKLEEVPQKLDPVNPEELLVLDSRSGSSESQSSSMESQSSSEENQSPNATTENSKEITNETTTSK